MQIRVATLRYNEAQQGFPEEALREIVAEREAGGTGHDRHDTDGGGMRFLEEAR
jgi:hypothetical protein